MSSFYWSTLSIMHAEHIDYFLYRCPCIQTSLSKGDTFFEIMCNVPALQRWGCRVCIVLHRRMLSDNCQVIDFGAKSWSCQRQPNLCFHHKSRACYFSCQKRWKPNVRTTREVGTAWSENKTASALDRPPIKYLEQTGRHLSLPKQTTE